MTPPPSIGRRTFFGSAAAVRAIVMGPLVRSGLITVLLLNVIALWKGRRLIEGLTLGSGK